MNIGNGGNRRHAKGAYQILWPPDGPVQHFQQNHKTQARQQPKGTAAARNQQPIGFGRLIGHRRGFDDRNLLAARHEFDTLTRTCLGQAINRRIILQLDILIIQRQFIKTYGICRRLFDCRFKFCQCPGSRGFFFLQRDNARVNFCQLKIKHRVAGLHFFCRSCHRLRTDNLLDLCNTGFQHLHTRVFIRINRQRIAKLGAQRLKLLLLRRQSLHPRRGHLPCRLEDLDHPQPLARQVENIAVQLTHAVLQLRLLAQTVIKTIGQCIRIGGLERQNTGTFFRQLTAEPGHLLFKELQRLCRTAGPRLDIFLLDQRQVFIQHSRRFFPGACLKRQQHQRGFITPGTGGNDRARSHRRNNFVGVKARLIIQNLQPVGNIQQVGAGQQPLLDDLQLFLGRG